MEIFQKNNNLQNVIQQQNIHVHNSKCEFLNFISSQEFYIETITQQQNQEQDQKQIQIAQQKEQQQQQTPETTSYPVLVDKKLQCTKPSFTLGAISKRAWIFILISMVTGSGSSLATKYQFRKTVPDMNNPDVQIEFNHPWMNVLMMFIGESICGLYYLFLVIKNRKNNKQQDDKPKFKWYNVFNFSIPTICDVIASVLSNIGQYMSLVSVYSMIRNINVLFVALISFIFVSYRQKFDLPQGCGLVILTIGVIITGIISIIKPGDSADAPNATLGLFITILSALFQALFYLTEEIFVRKLQVEASLGVCIEGLTGCVIMAILLPILNNMKSPFGDTDETVENSAQWAYIMRTQWDMLLMTIIYILFIFLFNLSGFETTKCASAAVRSTFGTIRPFIIWMCTLAFQWEKVDALETPVKFLGYIITVFGVLIYNNVLIIIPYFKVMNKEKYQKISVKNLQSQSEQLLNDV